MAVNFSLLPDEEPLADHGPSHFLWSVVFVLMALGLSLIVLWLWPTSLSAHTWKFWATLVLVPAGIPALLILRHWSHYEGYRLDVEMRNEAVRHYRERVFEAASRPLILLGAAYRFSASAEDNDAADLRSGTTVLKTRELIVPDHEPAKVRWLDVPGSALTPGEKADDMERHRKATAWLFDELLNDLGTKIKAVPSRLNLRVCLLVSNQLPRSDNESIWRTCWERRSLPSAPLMELPSNFDLYALDTWLDEIIGERRHDSRLIIAVQLHPLLYNSPPTGSAETGAAVLLAPPSIALQTGGPHCRHLFRPVRCELHSLGDAVPSALLWAATEARAVQHLWQTGLPADVTTLLKDSSASAQFYASSTNLDDAVGDAGVAAPWLALACANATLSNVVTPQAVFVGNGKNVDCCIVRCLEETPTQARAAVPIAL
ncbi:hypothetical protein LJR230_002234 [Trinickia sp. LjRoot230]|uniref:hypothetical protein n=1 Tax=Trinickia sp. LjRoot230 TaxID=3342288 RepID=UPI003ECF3749